MNHKAMKAMIDKFNDRYGTLLRWKDIKRRGAQEKGNFTLVLLQDESRGTLHMGVAKRRPDDKLSGAIGNSVATWRALKDMAGIPW